MVIIFCLKINIVSMIILYKEYNILYYNMRVQRAQMISTLIDKKANNAIFHEGDKLFSTYDHRAVC